MSTSPTHWDEEADVIVVGYGFAGATVAMTAHDLGAKVLLIEKAPEAHKGGNSRVSANIVFWPNDVEKAKTYFRAMAGPYMDNIPDGMLDVWAREMLANRAWLEGLGMVPVEIPYVEFPEFAGSDCVHVLLNGEGPVGGERLWRLSSASRAALLAADIAALPVVVGSVALETSGIVAVGVADGITHRFDRVYSAFGIVPQSMLAAAAGAEVDSMNRLFVDGHHETSIRGLFAAGDLVRGLNQIAVAEGEAAIAATAIHNRLERILA